MNSPRTLYCTNVRIPAGDAQSKQILQMAEAFSSVLSPGQFTLVSPKFEGQEALAFSGQWMRIRLPFASPRLRYLSLFLFQPALIRKTRAELIFTRDILIATAGILSGVRVCFEIHKAPKRAARALLRVIAKSARLRIVAISEALKTFLVENLGLDAERILVAHDATKTEVFAQLRKSPRSELRRELGLPLDKTVIVHPGRAARSRGFHLIEALMRSPMDFLFLQIGGTENDTREWKQKFGADPRLRFIPSLPHEEVFKYQVAGDLGLFFLTRETETWWCCSPLKIFEFMAAGTPILASGIGSVREVLSERNAMLFDPEDPDALVKGLKFFLENPEEMKRRAQAASTDPLGQASWKDRCTQIIEFENQTDVNA